MKVKGLNGTKFTPKSKLTLKHVFEADIKDIFGKVVLVIALGVVKPLC
jgi:hypothetical protein